MTTGDAKPGWSALAKGFVGAALLAIAGFLGTLVTNVLTAPKDSVAYDLVQSMTGLLKKEPPAETPKAPPATATSPSSDAGAKIAAMAPAPPPAAPVVAVPKPAELASAPSATQTGDAAAKAEPTESMLDRVRQTTELAKRTAAATAALAGSRVMTLNDGVRTEICGRRFRIDITSTAPGQGSVDLNGGEDPLPLAVGAPREIAAGCRVELLSAAEDLTTRRAQLRETKAR